jgi:hypothetical protein
MYDAEFSAWASEAGRGRIWKEAEKKLEELHNYCSSNGHKPKAGTRLGLFMNNLRCKRPEELEKLKKYPNHRELRVQAALSELRHFVKLKGYQPSQGRDGKLGNTMNWIKSRHPDLAGEFLAYPTWQKFKVRALGYGK